MRINRRLYNKAAYLAVGALVAFVSSQVVGERASRSPVIEGQASVIDGDTLDIQGTRIRLHGIDAPESGQQCYRDSEAWRCGKAAAFALDQYLDGRHLQCWHKGKSYDRIVAVCQVLESGEDVAYWLALNGWAVAAPMYSQRYLPAEAKAKSENAGIWDSKFVVPWIWRKQQKRAASRVHYFPADLGLSTTKERSM
ncbi:thermonuclease family protein [Alcanivorax sp.]|uniref:thermonuclease family protein n=1 Tax=Alcanivorax sp. TaxID=1872427 RepID=UPI002584C4A3|nr:thermonuclease family protein [Alcanivorax sp.]